MKDLPQVKGRLKLEDFHPKSVVAELLDAPKSYNISTFSLILIYSTCIVVKDDISIALT